MAPTPASQIPGFLDQDKLLCLTSLCILFVAINEACKVKNCITYSSHHTYNDSHLTEYQNFLCKLAQILDIQKGGDTVTALVAQKGSQGPNYLFVSNNRKEMGLQEAKKFLLHLLDTVGRNPNNMNQKPLKKLVLGLILEFNFPRLDIYLKNLTSALDNCIADCRERGVPNYNTIGKLQDLKRKADFPRDMASSPNAKSKFLRDCETLIKAIQNNKSDPIDQIIDNHANEHDTDRSLSWCELRHHLGRLLSYRRASDIIFEAPNKWPSLFQNFTVSYIPSARLSRNSTLKALASPAEVIHGAFPDLELSEYESQIQDLQRYGLHDRINEQLVPKIFKSRVHCEVYMHHNLVKQGKTEAIEFWDNSKFIATSKPPCRLCYYYFQDPNSNDFQLRNPHMNLYAKWQLPGVDKNQGEAANCREELIENMIEQLQEETIQILKDQFSRWRKHDSRTDSRTVSSAAQISSEISGSDTQHGILGLRMERPTIGQQMPTEVMVRFRQFGEETEWVMVEDDRNEIDREGEALMGVAI